MLVLKPSKETMGKNSHLKKTMKVTKFRAKEVINSELKWDIILSWKKFYLKYILDYHLVTCRVLDYVG